MSFCDCVMRMIISYSFHMEVSFDYLLYRSSSTFIEETSEGGGSDTETRVASKTECMQTAQHKIT